MKPLSPQWYSVQFTLSQHGHDLLRYAEELLGHQVPPGAEFMRHKRLAAAEVRGTANVQSAPAPRAATAGYAAGGSTVSRAGGSA